MTERVKKRIGEILIEDGILTREHLAEALEKQQKEGGLIGHLLIRLGYVSEEAVVAALSKQLKIPYLALSYYSLNPDAARLLEEDFCRKNLILIFDADEKYIYLCTGDPLNDRALAEIAQKTNLGVQAFISTPTEILEGIAALFQPPVSKETFKKAG